MDTLIDELFLFSKLDLNRVPFQFETVELNMFMQELIEEMQMDLRYTITCIPTLCNG